MAMKGIDKFASWSMFAGHSLVWVYLVVVFFIFEKYDAVFFMALIDIPISWLVDMIGNVVRDWFSLDRRDLFFLDFCLFFVLGGALYYWLGFLIGRIIMSFKKYIR
jgi:hypothetical protein